MVQCLRRSAETYARQPAAAFAAHVGTRTGSFLPTDRARSRCGSESVSLATYCPSRPDGADVWLAGEESALWPPPKTPMHNPSVHTNRHFLAIRRVGQLLHRVQTARCSGNSLVLAVLVICRHISVSEVMQAARERIYPEELIRYTSGQNKRCSPFPRRWSIKRSVQGPHETRRQSGLGVPMVDLSVVWTQQCMLLTLKRYSTCTIASLSFHAKSKLPSALSAFNG